MMSYSRTFCFQRGALCSVQDGVALWRYGTASFPHLVFAGICAPVRNAAQSQAHGVVVSLVSCGMLSSGTEDPGEGYCKCSQSL